MFSHEPSRAKTGLKWLLSYQKGLAGTSSVADTTAFVVQ